MSDLFRSALHARIAKLPDISTLALGDEDEDAEAGDAIGALPGRGLGPPAMPARSRRMAAGVRAAPNAAFAPLSASDYFESANQIGVGELATRVYYTPPTISAASGKGAVLVCHHGAGFSGLTFAAFAREVRDMTNGELGVLALDARAHGKTTSSGDDSDLSIGVLTDDLVALLKVVFPDPPSAPHILLVGHSMGGAVCTRACPTLQAAGFSLTGLTVLDVVEGTALDALPHMNSILNARPDGFDSVEQAVEWHVTTNTIRNSVSARLSVPSIVRAADSDVSAHPYVWRTPLRSTAPFWAGWFTGLSSAFLTARAARLLILAGADRLDRELMIGQMQGKFQMAVVPGVGHMLHEDDPRRLAEIVVDFWRRNERVVAGVKKVGEM